MTNKLYRIFGKCVEMMRQGASLEDCLTQYPAYAAQLEPLLLSATAPSVQPGAELTYGMRNRIRTRVLAEWDRRHSPRWRGWSFPLFAPRWAVATALVLGVILLGGAGTAVAAQDAVPGANLYSVKQMEEQTRLWFARSPEVKVATYSALVRERADEIRQLSARGDLGHTSIAVARLEEHISEVSQLAEEAETGQGMSPPAFEPKLLETIDETVVGDGPAAAGLQNALALAPDDAYPCLRHSLNALQSARQRVYEAAEKIGGGSPEAPVTQSLQVGSLCPQ